VTGPYFRYLLRAELLPAAENSDDPLSLCLVDVDSFVEVNESYGPEGGNEVLRAVARIMREVLPERAIIARYGGDELTAALPNTRLDDAFTLLEEVRRRVQGMRLEQWPELHVTCSVGLASAHGKGDVELMREADQALYVAKVTGRNKVSLPLADSRMVTKTSHYTATQLERLSQLARTVKRNEATLLREALDDLLKKYNDMLGAAPKVAEG
jgi:diguanylate cyclase (GGDEF)-like protein